MVLRLVGVAVGVQYGVTWAVVGILVGQIAGSCASGYAGHRLFAQPPGRRGDGAAPRSGGDHPLRPQVGHRHVARLDAEHAHAARPRRRRARDPGRVLPRRAGADHRVRGALGAGAPDPADRADAATSSTGRIAETYRSLRRYVVGATRRRARARPGRLGADALARPGRARHRLHPGDRCRPDPAARGLPAARARLDEVVPGLDRQAGPADRRSRRRDRRAAPARRSSSASRWGATGAAVGVLVATLAFAVTWAVLLVRLRREHRGAAADAERAARRREGAVVSGIWPPDVGGPGEPCTRCRALPARRAGHDGRGRRRRRRQQPAAESYPVRFTSRRLPVGVRHLHSLVARSARRARGPTSSTRPACSGAAASRPRSRGARSSSS